VQIQRQRARREVAPVRLAYYDAVILAARRAARRAARKRERDHV
jgi:hypothetical protein